MLYRFINVHTIVMQYIFKDNRMNLTKSLSRFYSTNQRIEKVSKNHYDTLKISPYATQNEVKSAYYKLTLQYHPDKNRSEYAKQKFQDISDAYEILSNHELRKNYDRRMMIHQQPMSNIQESIPKYKPKNYGASRASRVYNFDEWVHAHYEQQLQHSRERRQTYEDYKRTQKSMHDNNDSSGVITIIFLILAMTLINLTSGSGFDVTAPKVKKYVEKDEESTN